MKVALLSDCYLPRLGGIEVQVSDLAEHLRDSGHEVHVFTATPAARGGDGYSDRSDDPSADRPADTTAGAAFEGVRVHRLDIRLPFDLPVNPLAPRRLRRMLAQGGFDVAHVHTGVVSPFATDCTRVAVGLGIPTAMTWHCMVGPLEPAFRLSGYVRRWARAGVAMSAVSSAAARAVQSIVGTDGVVTVLPNGIDVSRWTPSDLTAATVGPAAPGPDPTRDVDSAGRPVPCTRVVTAMRLARRKRPLPLLRLMLRARALVPTGTPMTLEILGEGPGRRRMERFIEAHDMGDWVRLPGRVSREELRARYAASDVYVSPARLESFGIAALEARSTGLPVVARRESGVAEFVQDEVNGLLVADDEGMAAAVARLVTDTALRRRMREYNLQVPAEQTWEHVVHLAEGEYARAAGLLEVAR